MKDLVITCVFDAPVDILWKAWVDPEQIKHWWGPHDCTNPLCSLDLRPGGKIRIDMRSGEGKIYPMTGEYLKIDHLHELIFNSGPLDAKGVQIFEVLNTITFIEQGLKTKLILSAHMEHVTSEAEPYLKDMQQGWTQSLERLGFFLVKFYGM